jgi:hypothetical protein
MRMACMFPLRPVSSMRVIVRVLLVLVKVAAIRKLLRAV